MKIPTFNSEKNNEEQSHQPIMLFEDEVFYDAENPAPRENEGNNINICEDWTIPPHTAHGKLAIMKEIDFLNFDDENNTKHLKVNRFLGLIAGISSAAFVFAIWIISLCIVGRKNGGNSDMSGNTGLCCFMVFVCTILVAFVYGYNTGTFLGLINF